jgi:hypothetical protein
MAGIISGKEIEVPKEVQNILEPDERVLLAFQEAGLGGKLTGLESIFVTDRRVIKMRPKTLGLRADIMDYRYKDMASVRLNKGMLRSSIFIETRFQTPNVRIENIPKEGANRMFKTIQDGIAGRLRVEKVRQSEDVGVSKPEIDITEQIKKLSELRDARIITDEEFQSKKKDLLSKI